jgi:protein O-GlcNAc transferase
VTPLADIVDQLSSEIGDRCSEVTLNRAIALHQRGMLSEAERLCRQVLTSKPRSSTALHLLGLVCAQLGRPGEAADYIWKSLSLEPANPAALLNYAIALGATDRLDEAVQQLDLALRIDPKYEDAWNNRGACLWRLGKFSDALASYERALALSPNKPGILCNMGLCFNSLKRHADALVCFDRALRLDPNSTDAFTKRSSALRGLGRRKEALGSVQHALLIESNNTDALINYSALLAEGSQHEEALACLDIVIQQSPNDSTALNFRGISLRALNRTPEALLSYESALRSNANFVDALINRANIYWQDNADPELAMTDLARVITCQPECPYTHGLIVHLRMQCALWRDFERERTFLSNGVRNGKRIVRPFDYQAISASPSELQACARIFAMDQFPSVAPPIKVNRSPHRRIRLGYMSGEFREQATAYLTAGLYELHDRNKFEVFGIDNNSGDGSKMRARLEDALDEIISIGALADDEAAELIRDKEIDILINLNGYFGKLRMGVCAHRAAPIQVNYLGFPGTLGAPYIDYIIADRTVIPENERQFYDETVVYLPDCYQANDSRRSIAPQMFSREQVGLPQGAFVFCNFNQGYKLTPDTFSTWISILREVEDSVLWLLEGPGSFHENIRREAERRGVSANRIVFADPLPADQHLARIALADLFLDSLPYNAHTTASDALWAGVPLLTQRGSTFPGRVAASLLLSLGIPELITETTDDFIQTALNIARGGTLHLSLRERVAAGRTSSPLFDTERFARHIEAAYSTMWDRYQSEPLRP